MTTKAKTRKPTLELIDELTIINGFNQKQGVWKNQRLINEKRSEVNTRVHVYSGQS